MNKWTGTGRVTGDCELRYSASGIATGKFTLAVRRKFKDKQTGEYEADFPRCVTFSKTAEFAANYVKKGNRIEVVGRLQTGKYTDDSGVTKYTTDIIVEEIDIIDWPEKKTNSEESEIGQEIKPSDEDIPF